MGSFRRRLEPNGVLYPTHGGTGGGAAYADGSFCGGAERRTIMVGSSALRRPPANFVPASDLPLN
ncbi:MAG: hypothetical protein DMG57_03645 [Acidobacteria bacterium]|nr:MAG: hypothetical protein DMG57_03645 [Acidobacteriota bacterium]